jgi:nucleoporin POM152
MSGTPRLRSAFPSTPQSHKKNDAQNASATGSWAGQSSLPSLAPFNSNETTPLIPSGVLDAPSQRLYIAFFYLGLTVWRFYDYFGLIGDETESLWLFMKWVAIDSAVLYGLPGLRIPWLQWSSSTTTLLFVCHGICNAVMMFRIPVYLTLIPLNLHYVLKRVDTVASWACCFHKNPL